ncbi:MAG: hypothetical protein HQK51_16595 [Oligoflexia bacterium]|nr:hypothetical protein [Oligoflexia bacterium]
MNNFIKNIFENLFGTKKNTEKTKFLYQIDYKSQIQHLSTSSKTELINEKELEEVINNSCSAKARFLKDISDKKKYNYKDYVKANDNKVSIKMDSKHFPESKKIEIETENKAENGNELRLQEEKKISLDRQKAVEEIHSWIKNEKNRLQALLENEHRDSLIKMQKEINDELKLYKEKEIKEIKEVNEQVTIQAKQKKNEIDQNINFEKQKAIEELDIWKKNEKERFQKLLTEEYDVFLKKMQKEVPKNIENVDKAQTQQTTQNLNTIEIESEIKALKEQKEQKISQYEKEINEWATTQVNQKKKEIDEYVNLEKQKAMEEIRIWKKNEKERGNRDYNLNYEEEINNFRESRKAQIEEELRLEKEKELKFIEEWKEVQKNTIFEEIDNEIAPNIESLKAQRIATLEQEINDWVTLKKEEAFKERASKIVKNVEEDMTVERQTAIKEIHLWTKNEKERIQKCFEDEYKNSLIKLKKEITNKAKDEFQKIEEYFNEFKNKETLLAEKDIHDFLSKKLSKASL